MSEKVTPTYDPGLAAAVLEHMASLADALEPAIPVAFEELTAEPGALPRIMLKPAPSDAQERRYVSGEAIRPFPFTVTLRIAADSEQKRLDATDALQQLATAWGRSPLEAEGWSVFRQRQLTVPVCLGRTERFEDWQVTLELKYKRIL